MNADMLYTTNQPEMVEFAKKCYKEYPTIVNNIPKDTNKYKNTMHDFAIMDNMLAGSQRDIGESSNLAQLCLTYASCFDDSKYNDFIAILSVIAQASIDSAKRRFDIDIPREIARIKKEMNISEHGYPSFWLSIKRGFNKDNINEDLHCPMNYLQDMVPERCTITRTIPFGRFIVDVDKTINENTIRRFEKIVEKYFLNYYVNTTVEFKKYGEYDWDKFLTLRSDFDELIRELRENRTFSKRNKEFIVRLIDRAFVLEPELAKKKKRIQTKMKKNKALFLKVLYEINPTAFLSCFKRGLDEE